MPEEVTPLPIHKEEWPDGWGVYKHECIQPGCSEVVQFDDEPFCFPHEPDEGGHVAMPGWSAKAARLPKIT